MKVLLYSGGLDSTIVALMEQPEVLLFLDWGQKSAKWEWRTCKWWAKHYLKGQLVRLRIARLEGDYAYVPARNLNFVAIAVNWATVRGFKEILLGLRSGAPQPDTTPLWIRALNVFFAVIEPLPIKVRAPLHDIDYQTTLKELARDYPLERTFSCSLEYGVPCDALKGQGKRCYKCSEKDALLRLVSN